MKKISVLWTLTLCFFLAMPAFTKAEESENSLKMEELTIQVLPEYSYHPKAKDKNQPPLLIGYHGSLINNTDKALKGKIEIPLPTKEKNFQLGYVADYSTDLREMNEIEYELDQKQGIISWETSREIEPQEVYKFVIEYYTDSIEISKEQKTLEYSFKSFADIGLVNLIFVEPLKSDSFKLEPAAETHQKNTYNMDMFLYQIKGMKSGDEKKVKLAYERSDDRTTAEILEEMAGETGQKTAATTKKNEEKIPTWLIVSVVGGTTALAGILLFFILKTRSKKTKPAEKAKENNTEMKKAKLRQMVMDGQITEEEYKELLNKLGGN